MLNLNQLIEQLSTVLTDTLQSQGATAIAAFPTSAISPPSYPCVAIGLSEAALAPGGFGGEGAPQRLNLTFSLDIYGGRDGGAPCHHLFAAIAQHLLLTYCEIGCQRIWCEGIRQDQTLHTTHLKAFAAVSVAVLPA